MISSELFSPAISPKYPRFDVWAPSLGPRAPPCLGGAVKYGSLFRVGLVLGIHGFRSMAYIGGPWFPIRSMAQKGGPMVSDSEHSFESQILEDSLHQLQIEQQRSVIV